MTKKIKDENPVKKIVEIDNEEKEIWVCPYCDTNLQEYYYADGQDDYYKALECGGCGATWTE